MLADNDPVKGAGADLASQTSGVHTILGAGGAVANELVRELAQHENPVRLVARHPKPAAGAAEVVTADLSDLDETIAAISGSSVVYLLAGLKYDRRIWQPFWPRIMRNVIEACKRANAKLIFFDNVYMYGKVQGAMTEETPFNPCSVKGETRAQIATMLLDEIKSGGLTGLIARSADFYGPHVQTSVLNVLVFDKLAKDHKALWLANDAVPHSFSFVPDAARSLAVLARSDAAWNQTWHVPTSPNPPTGKQFVDMIAREFGVRSRHRTLHKPVIKVIGWFDTTIRELYEMLYQNDRAYLFDSTKYQKTFGGQPTSYPDGIKQTAASYVTNAAST